MARVARVLSALALAAPCLAAWGPVDGLKDLNVVEQALHQIEEAKLTPEQKKMSLKAVQNVEATVSELKSNSTMPKEQRLKKVHDAILELQGLQSQWELSAAETSLDKLLEMPHLNAKQRAEAKKVVADVDATVNLITAGKLTGAAQHEKVGSAIKELQDLQREWLNATTVSRVADIEGQMQSKKLLLKKDMAELKMLKLEKELAEKKMLLKKLMAQKDQSQALEKERKEDAAEQAMVAKLLSTAKALAGRKTNDTKTKTAGNSTAAPVAHLAANGTSPVSGILTDLKARAKKVSDAIDKMDKEETDKEAKVAQAIAAAEKGPKEGETAATKKGQAMLKMLAKQEHREYLKARAARVAARKELDEGVHSVETGDVPALTRLLGKMQKETKNSAAQSKDFLY